MFTLETLTWPGSKSRLVLWSGHGGNRNRSFHATCLTCCSTCQRLWWTNWTGCFVVRSRLLSLQDQQATMHAYPFLPSNLHDSTFPSTRLTLVLSHFKIATHRFWIQNVPICHRKTVSAPWILRACNFSVKSANSKVQIAGCMFGSWGVDVARVEIAVCTVEWSRWN